MPSVCILGSTGSVGASTEQVLSELRATHSVIALVANRSIDALLAQIERLGPRFVGVVDEAAGAAVAERLRGRDVELFVGPDAAVATVRAARADVVLAAITGAAGLAPVIEAARQGARLALANKEALVMAGHLLRRLAQEHGAAILPVDSEHSAIFQALQGQPPSRVRRLFLTASGGPFVDLPREDFARVTPAQALKHPTWTMGPKITIDSATMMNKALEIVEATRLFDVASEHIEVLVHRQSIVHSMVEFVDGSILAQLGVPSMTVPVRYALTWPDRAPSSENWFDLARFRQLTFEAPDEERFPALRLGRQAAQRGGLAGTALNAANEVAVAAFLAGKLTFDRIPVVVEQVLDRLDDDDDPDLETVLATDRWSRQEAQRWL
jgi:1-deoxy-D-xylulose-5-phosphate reductoisomerase